MVGAILACLILLAVPAAASASVEEEIICVGDSCQSLPAEPEDPTPGTLVPNPGNPPLHIFEPKAKPKHRKKHHRGHRRGGRTHGKGGGAGPAP
jgi:hypothetical protein